MRKSELQKFQDFKKRHNLTEIKIANILKDYANTSDEYAASFFSDKYHISEHVFYKMRDYCIIFMLVQAPFCQKIRDKTFRNQSGRNASGNYTSANRHYKELLQKRKEYLKSFSCEKITLIAIEYANGDTLSDIAKKHSISAYTVCKLLAIALANRLVCNKVYQSIKIRCNQNISSLSGFKGYTPEALWNRHF